MTEQVRIEIEAANQFHGEAVHGEQVRLGSPGDYKPCVAKLPGGELLLVAFLPATLDKGTSREEILLFRSGDGGRTWSRPRNLTSDLDVLGREPYLTVLRDGTVLITVHFLPKDVRNATSYTRSFVHRSEDGGLTWSTTVAEPPDLEEGQSTCTTRNILELADGTLMLGVAGSGQGGCYVWRSNDGGKTWNEKYPSQIEELDARYPYAFFGEGIWWQTRSGKIYLINRLDPHFVGRFAEPVPEDEYGRTDNVDRLILYETTDEGHSFKPVRPMGTHGEMYPALLRLADGRLLLTFTVRALRRPLGVRAIVGKETADEMKLDLEHDRFMVDTQTALNAYSGGGFGRSEQLDDGTLVTSYSWRDAQFITHVEVMRWRLPYG